MKWYWNWKKTVIPFLGAAVITAAIVAVSSHQLSKEAMRTPASIGLADEIYFRTHTSTFNRLYFFSLYNGRIWVKPNHLETGKRGPWKLLGPNGRPFWGDREINAGYIEAISVDGSMMIAVSKERKVFTTMDALKDPAKHRWIDRWGHPLGLGGGISLPENYRDWIISYGDPNEHKYYQDKYGNKFYHFCSTLYVLNENGQNIHMADPWTPSDWGYQFCGPGKGHFISESISASGSTVFLINKYGDMYTRQVDFDIQGSNPTLFYSYYPQKKVDGVFDRGIQRGIPPMPWVRQPKIDGRITKKITVFSTGAGSFARTLRVEGVNNDGEIGYFEKPLNGREWKFHAVAGADEPVDFLDNTAENSSMKTIGPRLTFTYAGYLDKEKKHKMILSNFDFHCSPNTLKIQVEGDQWITLKLHSRFDFRMGKRENPGMDGRYFGQTGAIEIPPEIATSHKIKRLLINHLDYWHKDTFYLTVGLQVKEDRILMKRHDSKDSAPLWKLEKISEDPSTLAADEK